MDSFENSIDKIKENLRSVQIVFDRYQKENFPERSPEFFCLELNGEAGELANLEKKKWKGKEIENELFFDEAADVLIALMNYANARQIDIGDAVKAKLKIIDDKMRELKSRGIDY